MAFNSAYPIKTDMTSNSPSLNDKLRKRLQQITAQSLPKISFGKKWMMAEVKTANVIESLRCKRGQERLTNCITNCLEAFRERDNSVNKKITFRCWKQPLCAICQLRRAKELAESYLPRIEYALQQHPRSRLYFVTLSVGKRRNEKAACRAIMSAGSAIVKALNKSKAGSNENQREMSGRLVLGGLNRLEFGWSEKETESALKRAKKIRSGRETKSTLLPILHSLHIHAIWLCSEEPSAELLAKAWKKCLEQQSPPIKPQSYRPTDIKLFNAFHQSANGGRGRFNKNELQNDFVKILRYIHKDMKRPTLSLWSEYKTLRQAGTKTKSLRVVRTFGAFRRKPYPGWTSELKTNTTASSGELRCKKAANLGAKASKGRRGRLGA